MAHPNLAELIDANDPEQIDPYIGWWTRPGRIILGEDLFEYDALDAECYTGARTPGALTIVQGCTYDPGSAVYRFHSALNHTTPHASLFFRQGNNNPYTTYRQLDMWGDRPVLAAAVGTADVLVCHVDTMMLGYTMVKWQGQLCVYYHGSEHPSDSGRFRLTNPERDGYCNAIQLGARLDHQDYGDLAWVPMAQPVRRLASLRDLYARPGRPGRDRPFRIAHSPTARSIKGSDVFEAVCDDLRSKGVNVEAVPISGHRHPQAFAWKATCDACFDSFWLGIQGSGLEAGAMGLPVIAGDQHVAEYYRTHVGYVPYIFADDARGLTEAIVALVEDQDFYDQWAGTARRYVWHWHSYERVASMFLNALAERTHKPDIRRRIVRALHTEPDAVAVPAMRPADVYPWTTLDGGAPQTPIQTPQGEPVRVPDREPVHRPLRRMPVRPRPEPVVIR